MRTVIAVLLNLILPPYGYYYLQSPRRFVLVLAVFLLLPLLMILAHTLTFHSIGAFAALTVLLLFVAVQILVYFVVLIDTLHTAAKHSPSEHVLFRRPAAWWFVPVSLCLYAAASIGTSHVVTRFADGKVIVSNSMTPGLQEGDFAYFQVAGDLRRGDIVTIEDMETGRSHVKRIIGVPGDHVELREETLSFEGIELSVNRIYLNGEMIPQTPQAAGPELCTREEVDCVGMTVYETIAGHTYAIREQRLRISLYIQNGQLGADEYYVLGDNRDDSLDSRSFGPVKRSAIRLQYLYTYAALTPPEDPQAKPDFWYFLSNPSALRLERCGIRVP